MNDVFPGSQTYGSSSHHQSMNEFTFDCGGPSSNSNPNSNSSLGTIGGGQAGSSSSSPLNSDDQNPIQGGLHIIDSLVPKI